MEQEFNRRRICLAHRHWFQNLAEIKMGRSALQSSRQKSVSEHVTVYALLWP